MSKMASSSSFSKVCVLLLRVVLVGVVCRFAFVSSTVGGDVGRGTSRRGTSTAAAKARGGNNNNISISTIIPDAHNTSSRNAGGSHPSTAMIRQQPGGEDDADSLSGPGGAVLEIEEENFGQADIIDVVIPPGGSSSQSENDDIDGSSDGNRERNAKERKKFFNHVARVSTMLLRREKDARLLKDGHNITDDDEDDDDEVDVVVDDEVTFQSNLRRPGRYIHIVTTASLPWMTGTAVNPLLRAAYLHERLEEINMAANVTLSDNKTSWVTLVIPWLELPEDQRKLYHGHVFETPSEQEEYVRKWLRDQAEMPDAAEHLNLVFYTARYHEELGSVFAMGDIIEQLPQDELDVCVLEEPEHVNWFRAPGQGWTKRYNYVVGIVHTNYDQYATQHYSGLWTAPAIRLMSAAMIRAYCHKVIKLSDVVQVFAPEKEVTVNVHGVRKEFIVSPSDVKSDISDNKTLPSDTNISTPIYFIGKLLWAKGLDVLLELEDYYKQVTGEYFPINIYGSGPDMEEIERAYLGRWTDLENPKTKVKKMSKSLFSRFFSFVNRRRWKRKWRRTKNRLERSRQIQFTRVSNSTNGDAATPEDLYKDILDVLDALPEKAKESMEELEGQAREAIGQWTEDIEETKKSIRRLPAKARRAVNKLIFDLSRTPLPRTLHELRLQPIPAKFPGRVDHAKLKGDNHKIFVNPSISEVLCTTTAEALAMGKFAIVPVHPENYFFLKNPNCLAYRTPYEFVANLQWALTHDPVSLTEEQSKVFTWEAATDRFLDASAITHREARDRELLGRSRMDERIAWFHNEIGKGVKGDMIRKAFGGGPVSDQVRYQLAKVQQFDSVDDESSDEGEEDSETDENEGLPRKFRDSAFVKALRAAFENGSTAYS